MTKVQLIELRHPIPSFPIHSLKYRNGQWCYVYRLYTPKILGEKALDEPLYIKGALQTLILTAQVPRNMVHIPLYTLQDLLALFKEQRKADLAFREHYEKSHKMSPHTLKLINRNHIFYKPTYLVRPISVNGNTTEFIGVQKHGQF